MDEHTAKPECFAVIINQLFLVKFITFFGKISLVKYLLLGMFN